MAITHSDETLVFQHGKARCAIFVSYRGFGYGMNTELQGVGTPAFHSFTETVEGIHKYLNKWIEKGDKDASSARELLKLFNAGIVAPEQKIVPVPMKQLSFLDLVA